MSTGNAIATDRSGITFVVGGYDPQATERFAPGILGVNPAPLIPNSGGAGPELSIGYITQYDTKTGQPIATATMGLSPTTTNSECATTPGVGYVVAEDIAIDTLGNIHVMGVFRGCDIDFYDASGAVALQTFTNDFYQTTPQSIFVVSYDPTLTPYAAHIISSDGFPHATHGGITVAPVTSSGMKLFIAANLEGTTVRCASFGNVLQPISPYDNLPWDPANQIDGYIGQIDLVNNQMENAIRITGPSEDYITDITAGSIGSEADNLYICGAFLEEIAFESSINGTTALASVGEHDGYVCRFNSFDLDQPEPWSFGGPFFDQALTISDNGLIVGGIMSDGATIGPNTFTLGVGNFPSIQTGNRTPVGFIAKRDWGAGIWEWSDSLVDINEGFFGRVTSIATSDCSDEFYIAWCRGMHIEPLDAQFWPYFDDHLLDLSINADPTHRYYSRLRKYEDQPIAPLLIWEHDFNPTLSMTSPVPLHHIAAEFVEDIEILIRQDVVDSSDVVICGRFGLNVDVPENLPASGLTINNNPNIFTGNLGSPFDHGKCGMFIAGFDERPIFEENEYRVCIDDAPFNIPVATMPAGVNYTFNNVVIHGTGIVDTILGTFDPSVSGYGSFSVSVNFDYFGCAGISHNIATVIVERDPYPIQPFTAGSDWAEGLAVHGWANSGGGDGTPIGDDIVFHAGRYSGSITFDMSDGSTHTLFGTGTTPSGYVVAYGPCGALWATNFESDAGNGGYIENIVLDPANANIYVCGAKDGTLSFDNSNALPGPTTSTNGFALATNTDEKGVVAELDALTGQVNWVYLGGNLAGQENTFHGLAFMDNYLFVIGDINAGHAFNFSGGNQATNAFDQAVFFVLNNAGAQLGIDRLASGGNCHGDAIATFISPTGKLRVVTTGHVGQGTVLHNTNINWYFTAPTDQDAYISSGYFDPVLNTLETDYLRIYPGFGPASGTDIIALGDNDADGYTPNHIIWSGYWEDQMATNATGGAFYNTAGIGDKDGFIASADFEVNPGWFEQVGTAAGFEESADALALHKGYVYATGKYKDPMPAPRLLQGLTPQPLGSSGPYTLQFKPAGTFVENSSGIAVDPSTNEGTDISPLDTSLISTGYILASATEVDFNETLVPNSNISDAFIGRIKAQSNTFFKTDQRSNSQEIHPGIHLSPNPNNGSFEMVFDSEITGHLFLYSSKGAIIKSRSLDKAGNHLESSDLESGVYFVVIQSENAVYHTSFVVQ